MKCPAHTNGKYKIQPRQTIITRSWVHIVEASNIITQSELLNPNQPNNIIQKGQWLRKIQQQYQGFSKVPEIQSQKEDVGLTHCNISQKNTSN